jgi:hypothetical protein
MDHLKYQPGNLAESMQDKFGEVMGPTALTQLYEATMEEGGLDIDANPVFESLMRSVARMSDADLIDWTNGINNENPDEFEQCLNNAKIIRQTCLEYLNKTRDETEPLN